MLVEDIKQVLITTKWQPQNSEIIYPNATTMTLDIASIEINVGTCISAKSAKNNLAKRKTVKQDILEDAIKDKCIDS